jgi:hypothetical protein
MPIVGKVLIYFFRITEFSNALLVQEVQLLLLAQWNQMCPLQTEGGLEKVLTARWSHDRYCITYCQPFLWLLPLQKHRSISVLIYENQPVDAAEIEDGARVTLQAPRLPFQPRFRLGSQEGLRLFAVRAHSDMPKQVPQMPPIRKQAPYTGSTYYKNYRPAFTIPKILFDGTSFKKTPALQTLQCAVAMPA